jgi:Ca2+-binding EF-hand superfamily protein
VILEEELNANFKKWDKNKNGCICQDELLDPTNGLGFRV